MARVFFNPHTHSVDPSDDARAPIRFHERLPAYAATPLHALPGLAERLGVRAVHVKDESSRLGLPAFKILGASWAVYRLAVSRPFREVEPWQTVEDLRAAFAPLQPLALATATDGNHGRAVARSARWFGFEARIFVPTGTALARIDAIAGEGASVTVVDGTYDDAVNRAAEEASERCAVVSDMSWPGYTEIPVWVSQGYSTLSHEVDDALAQRSAPSPDIVVVQVGVGALAMALVRHWRPRGARIVGVEPATAACGLAAVERGEIVTLPGPYSSIMAGLNCGTLSLVAWPYMRDGIDAFVAIEDERAEEAVRLLAGAGVVSGETGASGLGGLLGLLEGPRAREARRRLSIGPETAVLVISTEGATDPALYGRITASGAPQG